MHRAIACSDFSAQVFFVNHPVRSKERAMSSSFSWRYLVLCVCLAWGLAWGLLLAQPSPLAHAVTCTVTTNADNGAGSLREKIADLNCDTINFANDYTITLTSTLSITKSKTIDGAGHNITISGSNAMRVFYVYVIPALTLSNLTVANGKVTNDDGGGMNNNSLSTTLTNVTFSGNSVTNGDGGGIYNNSLYTTLTNVTFSGNSATNGKGGGISNFWVSGSTLTNVTFSGNTADQGGGMYDDNTDSTLTNVTFSGNSATSGGGMYSDNNSNSTLTNVTFSGNSATSGGGMYNDDGKLTLTNVIIANSTGGNCYNYIGSYAGWNNLADDGSCGSSFTNSASIALGTLGNYGGSTQTIPLLPGSAAIDAGNSANCPSTDQRGQARNDLQCDIGAYEMEMSDRNNTTLNPGTTMRTYGPPRAGIQYSGTNPGTTTVTKITTWVSQPTNALSVIWDISATTNTGLNLTLKLCYSTAEQRGLTEGDLRFWRYSGAWAQVGGVPTFSGTSPNRCAEIAGVTDLSRWTLATGSPGNAPSAVTLSSFNAHTPSFDLTEWFAQIQRRWR
jgi:predicted outer membrane repeat protein